MILVCTIIIGILLFLWALTDASLAGAEYQLWLKNQTSLFGDENLSIAPGYRA